MNQKLLVVDDDIDICEMLHTYFSREGYGVTCAYNGLEGLNYCKTENYALILLDVMMPQMNGFKMLESLRAFCDTPVILLTAKGEQLSKVKGFTKGCDDYVVKPFDLTELSLRIQAILKRSHAVNKNTQNPHLYVKDLEIDLEGHRVTKAGHIIDLTPKEYEILCTLATHKGRVYSTKMLYELIWKEPFLENDNSVITHIRNLREKIGDQAKTGHYIKTIWGAGYKIEKEN